MCKIVVFFDILYLGDSMKGRSYLLLIISIIIFSFCINVSAKDYAFYIDSTCTKADKDCFHNLDEALELVSGDKTTSSDHIYLNICNSSISFSHSYVINGHLKFVVDDVGGENVFELNGNNNTITTGKYIEFTGNSTLNLSNFNIKDTLADANPGSFTLAIYSQYVNLKSVSVSSLKYMGILGGDNLSEYDLDGVQISGAETALDYYGKSLNINNGTFDDNTMAFMLGKSETNITNSSINSIRVYEGANVTIDETNTLVENPLKLFVNDNPKLSHDDVDFDEFFIVGYDKISKVNMDLKKDSDIVLDKDNNKIDIFKLFNGVSDINIDKVKWSSSNTKVASIKDGYVLLKDEGEAKVSGVIPYSNIKLTVNFRVQEEKDTSLLGTINSILNSPKSFSTLFISFLMLIVIVGTILISNKRRKELKYKDVI